MAALVAEVAAMEDRCAPSPLETQVFRQPAAVGSRQPAPPPQEKGKEEAAEGREVAAAALSACAAPGDAARGSAPPSEDQGEVRAEVARLHAVARCATRDCRRLRREAEVLRARASAGARMAKKEVEAVRAVEAGKVHVAEARVAELAALLLEAEEREIWLRVALGEQDAERVSGEAARCGVPGAGVAHDSGPQDPMPPGACLGRRGKGDPSSPYSDAWAVHHGFSQAPEAPPSPPRADAQAGGHPPRYLDGRAAAHGRRPKRGCGGTADAPSPGTRPITPLPARKENHSADLTQRRGVAAPDPNFGMGGGSVGGVGGGAGGGGRGASPTFPLGSASPLQFPPASTATASLSAVEGTARAVRASQVDELRQLRAQLARAAHRQEQTDACQRERERLLGERQAKLLQLAQELAWRERRLLGSAGGGQAHG